MGIACDYVPFMHFLKQLLNGVRVDNETGMGAKEGMMGDAFLHSHLIEGLVDGGEGAILGGHDEGDDIGEGGETETEGVGGSSDSSIGSILVTRRQGGCSMAPVRVIKVVD